MWFAATRQKNIYSTRFLNRLPVTVPIHYQARYNFRGGKAWQKILCEWEDGRKEEHGIRREQVYCIADEANLDDYRHIFPSFFLKKKAAKR